MASNYVLLEKITVSNSASSVTFNNIPQTGYTDLKVVASARTNNSAVQDYAQIVLNGNTSSVYLTLYLLGDGSTTGSGSSGVATPSSAGSVWMEFTGANATSNTFGNSEFYIPNYTSSNYKSISCDMLAETNATSVQMFLRSGLFQSTAAISSITINPYYGTSFSQYSTFYLYGIAAVGTTPTKAPKAKGGDIIQTDGTYWYHAFLNSGTFTPALNLSCDVLVVGGGGGGSSTNSSNYGGAGGAGQVLAYTSQALASNTAQTVTIGSGGNGTASGNASNGNNSQFASLTAANGGGGGISAAYPGSNGGTSGNGYGSSVTTNSAGSGGGGATAIGKSGGTNADGTSLPTFSGGGGGAGTNTYSSWLSPTGLGISGYIAGGGGGGAYPNTPGLGANGGAGNGGRGGDYNTNNLVAPTANTGGGGSGGSTGAGSAGASGLVIVRYLM